MPEMRFHIRWPDGRRESCYSPSLVIKDHFRVGETYLVDAFVALSRTALGTASERVRQRYGVPCGLALGQLARIEAAARDYAATPEGVVTIESFEESKR